MDEHPAPRHPRAHAWVSSPRTASGVVEITRSRDDATLYRVCDPGTETIVFRGSWRDVLDFAAGTLVGPFMREKRPY